MSNKKSPRQKIITILDTVGTSLGEEYKHRIDAIKEKLPLEKAMDAEQWNYALDQFHQNIFSGIEAVNVFKKREPHVSRSAQLAAIKNVGIELSLLSTQKGLVIPNSEDPFDTDPQRPRRR